MDNYPAVISPTPTPPPDSQSVAHRLQRNSLKRRQAGAQTCGWWFGISCATRLYPQSSCLRLTKLRIQTAQYSVADNSAPSMRLENYSAVVRMLTYPSLASFPARVSITPTTLAPAVQQEEAAQRCPFGTRLCGM